MRALVIRKLRYLAIAVLALPFAAPFNAQAANLSYRNVDFAYFLSAEIDDGNDDIDGDGLQLRGMVPVNETFFALAEFQAINYDFDIDTVRFLVGGGGHWPLTPTVDIIARLGAVNYQVDYAGGDDDDTGLFLGGRIRAMITPQFELEGGVEYYGVDVAGIDGETVLIGEARYHFNSQWSAGVLFSTGSDTSNFGLQGRFNF